MFCFRQSDIVLLLSNQDGRAGAEKNTYVFSDLDIFQAYKESKGDDESVVYDLCQPVGRVLVQDGNTNNLFSHIKPTTQRYIFLSKKRKRKPK